MWNMVTLDGYFDGERSWEIQPIVLSDGSPSFESKPPRLSMKLLEARPSKSGRMVLRYEAGVTKASHDVTRHRLRRNSRGARAKFSATRRSAVDGPFVETKEWALGSGAGS